MKRSAKIARAVGISLLGLAVAYGGAQWYNSASFYRELHSPDGQYHIHIYAYNNRTWFHSFGGGGDRPGFARLLQGTTIIDEGPVELVNACDSPVWMDDEVIQPGIFELRVRHEQDSR